VRTPALAGWGFFALKRTTDVTLHETYDRVHCDLADPECHGAAKSSNNTGELTAVGKARTWISLATMYHISSNEVCSDSAYALDVIDLTAPPIPSSSNKDLIHLCLKNFEKFVARGTSCSSGRSRHTTSTNQLTPEGEIAPPHLLCSAGERNMPTISRPTSPTRLSKRHCP